MALLNLQARELGQAAHVLLALVPFSAIRAISPPLGDHQIVGAPYP